jgi:hypothetical protein
MRLTVSAQGCTPSIASFLAVPDLEVELVDIVLGESERIPIQGALPMSVSVAHYCADRRSIAYQKKIERSRMKAPIQSSTIGTKGLTFKTSCYSSVAIAPAK